jgi:hypothetical protein
MFAVDVLAIPGLFLPDRTKDVDARDKPAHDHSLEKPASFVPRMLRSAPQLAAWCAADPGLTLQWAPALRCSALDDAEPVIGRAFARPVGIARKALHRVRDTIVQPISTTGKSLTLADLQFSLRMPRGSGPLSNHRWYWAMVAQRKRQYHRAVCCRGVSPPPAS